MEIEKGKTSSGQSFIRFKDHYDMPCEMNTGYHNLEFQVNLDFEISPTCAVFSQEQIKTLLPYLQSFVETGELEPQESTLQGGIEQLTRELLKASKLVENGFVSDEEVEAYSDACTHFIREARKLLGE